MNVYSNFFSAPFFVLLATSTIGPFASAQMSPVGPILSSPRARVLADREQAFIESTATRDLEQLLHAISEPDGENYLIVYSSGMQPSMTGRSSVPLRAILADRRIAKLHALLSGMPKAEASERISNVFADKFQRYQDDWNTAINEGGTVLFGEPRYGLMATLFLCFEFCDVGHADQLLRQWVDWYQSHRQKSRQFARRAGPDALTIVNLYAIVLAKQDESLTEIDGRVQQMCDRVGLGQLPDLQKLKFYKWDATFEQRDDPNAVLIELPVFLNWGTARDLAPTDESGYEISRQAILNTRAWVIRPSLAEQWIESIWRRWSDWVVSWFQ